MKDWADKYHVWGTPQGHLQGQTRDNSNTRFFTLNIYNICRIYVSYHMLFEEINFVLSNFTHIWNAHVAGNLLKIKKTRKMKHAYNKDKTGSIILKR